MEKGARAPAREERGRGGRGKASFASLHPGQKGKKTSLGGIAEKEGERWSFSALTPEQWEGD